MERREIWVQAYEMARGAGDDIDVAYAYADACVREWESIKEDEENDERGDDDDVRKSKRQVR